MKLLKFYFRYFTFRSLRKVKNIETVIQSHGFRIYHYRMEEINSKTTELIRSLGCEELAGSEEGFVVTNSVIKGIFIKKGLSDVDQLNILFHEEGHIWYNHANAVSFTDKTPTQKEVEAQRFYPRLKALKFITVLLTIAILIAGVFFLTYRPSEPVAEPDPIVDTTVQNVEPPAQSVDTETIFPEDPVWITAEGDAYHREFCGTITGSHTTTQLMRMDAEQLGRHSCSYCNP